MGDFYNLIGGLSIYTGSFEGRKWQGVADMTALGLEENIAGRWHAFEAAEASAEHAGRSSVRLSRSEIEQPESQYGGVVNVPVSDAEARLVFDQLRAEYQEWERNRLPNRTF